MRTIMFFLAVTFTSVQIAFAQTSIQMEQYGGVYKIPCKVNGLGLKFIFDTGASDVSLSLTEALFMLKNGYLSKNDFLGTEYYKVANGDIQEGTKVNLRVIEVGGRKIYNVQASIVHTSDAPLLFGQSALQRFGKFSIDYTTNTLTLGISNSTGTEKTTACKDVDGNVYKCENLEGKIWMLENLNVTRYRNGDTIHQAKSEEDWKKCADEHKGCWCFYENQISNSYKCGRLYNWYAVNDKRGLAPKGWHISSQEEWGKIAEYYNQNNISWHGMPALYPGGNATTPTKNVPLFFDEHSEIFEINGGYRNWDGKFYDVADWYQAKYSFWTSSDIDNYAYSFFLPGLPQKNVKLKSIGLYVRCIQD